MFGNDKERWMSLCEQAALEQDSERLMALVAEINALLDRVYAAPPEVVARIRELAK